MKSKRFTSTMAAAVLMLMSARAWAQGATAVDIKRAAPTDAFMAVYAKHNPERDYQRQYFADVWKTIQQEKIGERLLNIVTSRVPGDQLTAAKSKLEELHTAIEPIQFQAIMNADEFMMAETFEGPVTQVLLAVRLSPAEAANFERGLVQAMELISRWSEGKVPVNASRVKEATVTVLSLPEVSPIQPAIGRLNDIVLFGTNVGQLRRSLEQLQDATAKSKFDDPRLQEALTHLPKPEDSLMFFDGQKLFQNLRGLGDFIRGQAKNDPNAARAAHLLEQAVDAAAILDYEVTVQFTEPGQNHSVALGKLVYDYQDKLIGRAIAQSTPIEHWQSWVPKDATAFALNSGVNLHELYGGIVKLVQSEFPESQPGFDQFAAAQEKIGVNLDRDILQSFSGESVSVTVPIKSDNGSERSESFFALKCTNAARIRELLTRGIDALNQIPAVQAQQVKLETLDDLNGFQKLSASVFQIVGIQPVIGFRDGWMIVASHRDAAEKVLAVRDGKAESIEKAARFEGLGIDLKGPVYSVSDSDIGAGVRHAADVIDKIGGMAPLFLGMAAGSAKPEDLKPVQEVIALLPSAAKIVRKFDFYGQNVSVSHKGPVANTYLRESVTEVRMPKAEK